MRKERYTFKNYCNDSGNNHLLGLWDDELNKENPDNVGYRSNKKYYFKCPRGLHESRLISLDGLTGTYLKGKEYCICKKCNSIGQYIIDNFGEEYLKLIWSDVNTVSYYDISKSSTTNRIWLKCLNNTNHQDYSLYPNNFQKTHTCPYCVGKKPSITNNLLDSCPGINDVWSNKNTKLPQEYTRGSGKYVWLKCKNNKHEDFRRSVCKITSDGIECPECQRIRSHPYDDLTGLVFGELTVLKVDESTVGNGSGIRWICQCSCGSAEKSILGVHLKSGKIKSCGCLWIKSISGENHYNWKGGITPENDRLRTCWEYKAWRNEVLKFDNYKCIICSRDNHLEAHHINPFSDFETQRFDVSNGLTLCRDHHSHTIKGSFHNTYGTCNNTPSQLEEYINNERKKYGNNEPFNIDEYINKKKTVGIVLTMSEFEEYENYEEAI